MIQVKRVYEPASPEDGIRVLVDRIWPRGMTKQEARLDMWLKEIAPSTALRKWFAHDPAKWTDFKKRYAQELDSHREILANLAAKAKRSAVTLLFGSKEERYNNAAALKEYLERRRSHGPKSKRAA
jgi:uncharacterized protein YeaO (DUF488 family)